VERGLAPGALELGLHAARRIVVVPRVERVEAGRGRLARSRDHRAAQVRVDVQRRLAAVPDRRGDRTLGGHDVAAGEHAGAARHQVAPDADYAVGDLDAVEA